MNRTPDALDVTADQLLDFVASDGQGASWCGYAELDEWEIFYNLRRSRGFVGKLVRNLEARRLAEVRRAAAGMQFRLTKAGLELSAKRADEAAAAWRAFG